MLCDLQENLYSDLEGLWSLRQRRQLNGLEPAGVGSCIKCTISATLLGGERFIVSTSLRANHDCTARDKIGAGGWKGALRADVATKAARPAESTSRLRIDLGRRRDPVSGMHAEQT